MPSDERHVKTMAGWIGVEISKSRARNPEREEYGLYRVRGSVGHRTRGELAGLTPGSVTPDGMAERGPWTAYAFTLERIESEVHSAIVRGVPAGPIDLVLPKPSPQPPELAVWIVPTRWTSAYRGRRDLGSPGAALVVAPNEGKSTVRSRQRAANRVFQHEHLKARAWGLEQRRRRKLSDNVPTDNEEGR